MRYFQTGGLVEPEEEQEALAGLTDLLAQQGMTTQAAYDEALQILEDYRANPPGTNQQAVLDRMQKQESEVKAALTQARKRLSEAKYNKASLWFPASAGFGAPTRTGNFAESMGNVGRAMVGPLNQREQWRHGKEQDLTELDLLLAKSGQGTLTAEMEMERVNADLRNKMALQALKTLGKKVGTGGAGGAGGGGVFQERKEIEINKYMELAGLSEADATALAYGKTDMALSETTGNVVYMNEMTKTAFEVPFSQAKAAGMPVPEVTQNISPVEKMEQTDTLWEMAMGTGPMAAGLAAIAPPLSWLGMTIPSETVQARHSLKIRAQSLAKALVENPRMPVRLIEMGLELGGMQPEIWDSEALMHDRMIALDRELYGAYEDAKDVYENEDHPAIDRREKETLARYLFTILRDLGVPDDLQKRRARKGGVISINKSQLFYKTPMPEFINQTEWNALDQSDKEEWIKDMSTQRSN